MLLQNVNIWKTEYTTIASITPHVVHSTLAELTRIECMGVRLKEGSLIGGAGWGDVEETMREEDGTITSLLTINNLSHKRSAALLQCNTAVDLTEISP